MDETMASQVILQIGKLDTYLEIMQFQSFAFCNNHNSSRNQHLLAIYQHSNTVALAYVHVLSNNDISGLLNNTSKHVQFK